MRSGGCESSTLVFEYGVDYFIGGSVSVSFWLGRNSAEGGFSSVPEESPAGDELT